MRSLFAILCCLALPPLLSACSGGYACGDETVANESTQECEPIFAVCGDGTVEQNGICRPIRFTECGPGTVLRETECVPISDTVCGEGTSESNDTCLPDVVCGLDTQPNTDGECVPSFDVTCGPGTAALGEQCLPLQDVIAAGPTVDSLENDDPQHGGQPLDFNLAPQGDSIVLAGTLDPPEDLDGDNQPDQDVDSFQFNATAGQVIQIIALSSGPGVAFLIEGASSDNAFYARQSALNQEADPQRLIVIPTDGLYRIHVTVDGAFQDTVFTPPPTPIGSTRFTYHLIVETADPIVPLALLPTHVPAQVEPTFDRPHDNTWLFFPPDETERLVQLEVDRHDPAFRPAMLLFSRDLDFIGEIADYGTGESRVFSLPAEGVVAVQDWISADGFANTPDQVRVIDATITPLPAALTLSTSTTTVNAAFEAPVNRLIEVTLTPPSGASGTLSLRNLAGERLIHTPFSDAGPTTLRYFNTSGTPLQLGIESLEPPTGDYTVDITARTVLTASGDAAGGYTSAFAGLDTETWIVYPDATVSTPSAALLDPSPAKTGLTVSVYAQDSTFRTLFEGEDLSAYPVAVPPSDLLLVRLNPAAPVNGNFSLGLTLSELTPTTPGDTCETANPALISGPGQELYAVSLENSTNAFSAALGNACTTGDDTGADHAFGVDVPDGHVLRVVAHGDGAGEAPHVSIVQLGANACANPSEWTCAATGGGWRGASVSWTNTTGASQNTLVVIDHGVTGPYAATDLNTLTLTLEAAP